MILWHIYEKTTTDAKSPAMGSHMDYNVLSFLIFIGHWESHQNSTFSCDGEIRTNTTAFDIAYSVASICFENWGIAGKTIEQIFEWPFLMKNFWMTF